MNIGYRLKAAHRIVRESVQVIASSTSSRQLVNPQKRCRPTVTSHKKGEPKLPLLRQYSVWLYVGRVSAILENEAVGFQRIDIRDAR